MISENINTLRKEKELSVIELAKKAEISRQAMNNIVTGKSIPREDTLELIAEALGVSADLLKYGIQYFNYDNFRNLLNAKFPECLKKEDLEACLESNVYDEQYQIEHGLTEQELDEINAEFWDHMDLESFLVSKFDIDPVELFVDHIVPRKEIQKQIATYFGYTTNELFKCYGGVPIGASYSKFKRQSVVGKEPFDDKEFLYNFGKLSPANKKLVSNMCLDLLLLQNN